LAPPLHVGRVAEGADHQDAGPLVALDEIAREDRHGHAEERRQRLLADERLVALVLRVRGDADARRQQLGPRGGDGKATPALDPEAYLMERALLRAVLDLGLRDGRAEVHVPERGRLDLVDVALSQQVEEAPLRELPAERSDRGVLE